MGYGKTYNGDEIIVRETVFNENMAAYMAHNADESQTYTMGPNQFSDLKVEEFQALNLFGYKKPATNLPNLGVHEHVGEQQLMDCSKANNGCGGGNMESAFAYQKTVNVATETSYPYKGVEGTCRSTGYTTSVQQGGVTGYKSVGTTTAALKSALQLGPVSVAIEADQMSFQGYKSGILMASACGSRLDHGVTLVGYDSSKDYFIVKNSWGASWGNNGFVYLSAKGNTCGILSDASYPTVSSAVQV